MMPLMEKYLYWVEEMAISAIISHMTYKGVEWIVYSDTLQRQENTWGFYRYDGYGDPVDNSLLVATHAEDLL